MQQSRIKVQFTEYCDRLEWGKRKPRPSHSKADSEELEHFKATFPLQVQQLIQQRQATDTRPLLMMALDEGRFGRGENYHPVGVRLGFRPTVMRQQVRQYTYAYAAVAPAIGKMCTLVLPYANTAMMNLFLAQISIEFL